MANYAAPKNKYDWTKERLEILINEFPTTLNRQLTEKLETSLTNLHKKARELGLKKVPDFHQLKKAEIGALISEGNKKAGPNSGCFRKGEHPSPEHEFKKGHGPLDPETEKKRLTRSRNTLVKTIYYEKVRLKYGLPQQTKLKLKRQYHIDCAYLRDKSNTKT